MRHAKEDRSEKSKPNKHGHLTSSWTWTAKSICSHRFVDRISEVQKQLSDNGEKVIRNYRATLTNVFDALTEEEVKECEELATEWNTQPLPDYVQLQ